MRETEFGADFPLESIHTFIELSAPAARSRDLYSQQTCAVHGTHYAREVIKHPRGLSLSHWWWTSVAQESLVRARDKRHSPRERAQSPHTYTPFPQDTYKARWAASLHYGSGLSWSTLGGWLHSPLLTETTGNH